MSSHGALQILSRVYHEAFQSLSKSCPGGGVLSKEAVRSGKGLLRGRWARLVSLGRSSRVLLDSARAQAPCSKGRGLALPPTSPFFPHSSVLGPCYASAAPRVPAAGAPADSWGASPGYVFCVPAAIRSIQGGCVWPVLLATVPGWPRTSFPETILRCWVTVLHLLRPASLRRSRLQRVLGASPGYVFLRACCNPLPFGGVASGQCS